MVSAIVRPVVGEQVVDLAGAGEQRVGDFLAGLGERYGDVADGVGEARDEVFAARGQLVDHRFAGGAERDGDLLAAVGEGGGDAIAGGGDVVGDRLRRDAQVLRQRFLGGDDRGADALGVDDDGLALAGEVVDESAHARLVVGIGALEGGDFVMDEEFQLAGARKGPLDAVADGGDFAAHGLADVDHGVGGDVLRLGEARRPSR